jgi:hypothetical protein
LLAFLISGSSYSGSGTESSSLEDAIGTVTQQSAGSGTSGSATESILLLGLRAGDQGSTREEGDEDFGCFHHFLNGLNGRVIR